VLNNIEKDMSKKLIQNESIVVCDSRLPYLPPETSPFPETFKLYVAVSNTTPTRIAFSVEEIAGVFEYFNQIKSRLDWYSCCFKNSRVRTFKTHISGIGQNAQFQYYYHLNPESTLDLVEFYVTANTDLLNNVFQMIMEAQKHTSYQLVYFFQVLEPRTNCLYGPKIPLLSVPYIKSDYIRYNIYSLQLEFWSHTAQKFYYIDINTRNFFK